MKKILILTLGTGVKSEEEKKTNATPLLEDRISGTKGTYQLTNYQFNGNEVIENVSFVAEPLIENYKPDYVYILGTQNSAWTTFWINFYKKENWDDNKKANATEIIRPVWDIENAPYDKSKITEFQTVIQKVYEENLLNILNIQKIKVVLLPYGINKEELDFIYNTIFNQFENDFKEDEQVLGEKEKYDVAFDITHSFRSLPIYNYAVLTYFKQITSYEVNIKEIYYGMLEAKKICNGVAPIVKLKEISNIMDLTSAVAEFNNTGSVKALVSFLQQVQNNGNQSVGKMIEVLNEFDWAAGTNSGSLLIESIEKLNQLVNEQSETKDIYDDIKIALRKVLEKPVIEDLKISLKDIKKAKTPMEYADYQLVLSQWYFDQHRYSQSACIACEAFKSYMICFRAKIGNDKVTIEKIVGRKYRKEMDDWIQKYELALKKGKSNCCEVDIEFLKEALGANKKAHSLRNSSAHILQRSGNIEVLVSYIEIIEKLQKELKKENKLNSSEIKLKQDSEIGTTGNFKEASKQTKGLSGAKNIKKTTASSSKVIGNKIITKITIDGASSKEELKAVMLMNCKMSKPAIFALVAKMEEYVFDGLTIKKGDKPFNGNIVGGIATSFISWNSIVEDNKVHIPPFDINDSFNSDHVEELLEQHKFVFTKNTYTVICDSEERFNKFLNDLVCYKLIMNEIRKGPVSEENRENFKKVVDAFLK